MSKRRWWIAIGVVVALADARASAAQERFVVAVLEVENPTEWDGQDVQYLGDLLREGALAAVDTRTIVMTRENILSLLPQDTTLVDCSQSGCEVEFGRRLGADLVVSSVLRQLSSGELRLTVSAHDTVSARLLGTGTVGGADFAALVIELEASVHGWLAEWLSTQGGGTRVDSNAAQTLARLEVMRSIPPVVAVWIDGVELGPSNRQYTVEPGRRTVELRALGYEPHTAIVQVSAGAVSSLTGIRLAPLPAEVRVVSNVAGADVIVDGSHRGSTNVSGIASIAVEFSAQELVVERAGYIPRRVPLDLVPGALVEVSAELQTTPAGTHGLPEGFVLVPAGTFVMGSPSGEDGRYRDERQRDVTLTHSFSVQATEVTQGQWREHMGGNPAGAERCGDRCPVERVSWWDAIAYVNALSRSEGLPECYEPIGCAGTPGSGCAPGYGYCDGEYRCSAARFAGVSCQGYRLPSEAEWEYVARANELDDAWAERRLRAWYLDNSQDSPHPAAVLEPNAWGVYDMLGNVSEWTQDWYSDERPPPESLDPTGPETGSSRVCRGGGWDSDATDVRPAARDRCAPSSRSHSVGFRPVRTMASGTDRR